jgi:putative sigma-54 modulation protein
LALEQEQGKDIIMHISIAGVHMETSEALREHTQQKLEGLTTTFDQVLDVNVKFVQEQHHSLKHAADVTVHANGLMMRAEGRGGDWYGALDEAVGKIQKQLKKYKGKLEQRRAQHQEYKEQVRNLGPLAFEENTLDGTDGQNGFEGVFSEFAPDISKKEVSKISAMSVDEAVMQMDLLHKPAFLFMNVDTQVLNMVYREGENAVRWVAPKAA